MTRHGDIFFAFLVAVCVHGVGGVVLSTWIAPLHETVELPQFKAGSASVALTVVPPGEPEIEPAPSQPAATVPAATVPVEPQPVEPPEPAPQPVAEEPALEETPVAPPEPEPESVPMPTPAAAIALPSEEPAFHGPGREADDLDIKPVQGGVPTAVAPGGSEGDAQPQGVETVAACDVDMRPRYPLGSRLRGEEGTVTLRIRVGPARRADSVKVVTSSGFASLDRAAVSAVRSASFTPRGARTRPYGDVLISVRFQLVD